MTIILFYLTITAHPTPQKFALYDWLAAQGWQADRDYWMGIYGQDPYMLSMRFTDSAKAAMFKLAWNDSCTSTQSISPITAPPVLPGNA